MRHTRTRTGCLTCRRRRKKCDEKKPNCSGCIRNNLECSWPFQLVHPATASDGGGAVDDDDVQLQITSGEEENDHSVKSGDRNKDAVQWSARSLSFLANERACLMLSISPALLEHYICDTSVLLPAAKGKCNPFLGIVMPLAYTDDLLMHAVLCLSATHLSCERGSTLEIQKAISAHYSAAVKTIRSEIGDVRGADYHKLLRLLIVLVFISFYEAASGDVSGSMFAHLRAGRQLISYLSDRCQNDPSADRRDLTFIAELYVFTACINTLTPLGAVAERTIAYNDEFSIFNKLVEQENFGVMFSGLRELFKLIPEISRLWSIRLQEEKSNSVSAASQETCERISQRIESFELPDESSSDKVEDSKPSHMDQVQAAEMYRHGLRIFLMSSMAGSAILGDDLSDQMQQLASLSIDIARSLQDSPILTSLLWPCLIAGSCLVDRQQQARYMTQLTTCRFKMYHVLQYCNLLQLLWDDEDPHCFGPYGLYLTMKKHNINICLF